nr:MAG TPA: hypothetical protein [Microviridae sp.]
MHNTKIKKTIDKASRICYYKGTKTDNVYFGV